VDRLDELAVLLAVVDQGSLVAAARRLRRSPPAVTRALATLEERVGTRLVERTTRRLAVSEAGRALAEQARALLSGYDAAVVGSAPTPVRGLIRVTAPVQFGRRHVAPLVVDFLDSFPESQVELVLHDRNLDLIEEGIDLAVRIGVLSDSSLLVRRVGEVRHETIFGTATAAVLEWRLGSSARSTAARLAPRFLVNDIEAQLVAVRAGRGIARVLSYQVLEELASGALVRVLEAFEPPPLPVQLVTVSRAHMSAKVRAFLDYAADRLGRLRVS
jgi:DNA-binding transcriptional LysR family regulator